MDAPHARKSRLTVPVGGDAPMSPTTHTTTAPRGKVNASLGSTTATMTNSTTSTLTAATSTTTSVKNTSMNMSNHGASSVINSNSGNAGKFNTLHPRQHSSAINTSTSQYLERLSDIRQMDIQSALDQMRTLLSLTRPQAIYKMAYYRKQTKNHWARDDPAFCVLQLLFLIIASVAYAVAFRSRVSVGVSFLLCSVLWNWLGMGILMASAGRELANRHLVSLQVSNSHVRQHVEWLYAFDIHCNSFFPLFVLLYGVQYFAIPVALGEGLLPLFVANTMYAAALCWYWYITHLGYRALPFLSNTEVFLFPIAAIVLLYLGTLIGYPFGFGWNAARVMARFYFPSLA